MTHPMELQARIAQIKGNGQIAPPHTWISSYNVNKNGKKYTYYRLMKADPTRSSHSKVRGKMVKYLGSADSKEYKKMKEAIARRNQLQDLLRQLQTLEKEVSGGQTKKKHKQPPLTTLVVELMTLVQELQAEIQSLKEQLKDRNRTPKELVPT
ncbi:hypothetical protein [Crocosphaera sp. XPORK-15E]|uniref:hypothetical protein n=1 Tax=Crocosphaera sp. XPORK-15E TaxID=3110247 RepID=UPI002B1F7BED|nr:hypothetical protein [Crocosphaera sp. XPORK-15E]MEA5537331.1 hypothetical protein [Crocosphaera sp. XPORK-15E]